MYRNRFVVLLFVLLSPLLLWTPARADALSAYYDGLAVGAKKLIQQNLIWAGHYPGPVDGAIGAGTLKAIQQFQIENGEPASGIMSARVFDALTNYAQREKSKIKFQYVTDRGTGVRIGIPFATFPKSARRCAAQATTHKMEV